MKQLVICVLILLYLNSVKGQVQGMAILEKIAKNSIDGLESSVPVVRDTIWFFDSLVIHQISSYNFKTDYRKDGTFDTAYYEPQKYIFLDLGRKLGTEYCRLTTSADAYCRFSFTDKDTITESMWWYYRKGFLPNFKKYQVVDLIEAGDTLKKVVCSYSNASETYSYTYTMRKQQQYIFHLQGRLDELFPEFTTIRSEFSHDQYSETRALNLVVHYNTLTPEQITMFKKFKSDCDLQSIPEVDFYSSIVERAKMNQNCKLDRK